jgi:hypothetical protein
VTYDLWLSKDDQRIFTACGTAFRAAPLTADDMTYNGALEGAGTSSTRFQYVAHDALNDKVYPVPSGSGVYTVTTNTAVEAQLRVYSSRCLWPMRGAVRYSWLLGDHRESSQPRRAGTLGLPGA